MALSRTRGLCLRVFEFRETSQVVWLYTRESGKVHAIAKGAKRPRSKFHGAFDLLGLYDTVRVVKPAGLLDILTEAELVADFRRVRGDPDLFALGCYALELVERMTPEGQPSAALYDLLAGVLAAWNAGEADPGAALLSFEAQALGVLGYRPRVTECGRCRRPVRGERAYFGARDGGAVCGSCVPRDPLRIVVRRGTLDAIEALSEGGRLDPAPAVRGELRYVLDSFVIYLAEQRLRSARQMRQAYENLRRAG